MTPSDIPAILIGTLTALITSTGFLLVLFVGFCFFAGLTKFRKRDRNAMVVRSLSERIDGHAEYLSHAAPDGPADQLRTPELLEQAARNS